MKFSLPIPALLLLVAAFITTVFVTSANADEFNQQLFDEQLLSNIDEIKTKFSRQRRVDIKGTPKELDTYHIKNSIEQALEHGDYDSVSEILSELHLMITASRSGAFSGITIHPMQESNSADSAVKAILNKDTDALKEALKAPDDSLNSAVYVSGAIGNTPLIVAMQNGDTQAIKQLLSAGVDPERSGDNSYGPVEVAKARKDMEVMEMLIDAGINVNTRMAFPFAGATMLSYSATTGNLALAQKLLEKGADPTLGDVFGWTPLMDAVHAQNLDMVLLLLPVSDPSQLSTKAISDVSAVEKGIDRRYPRSSAVYISEQIKSPVGDKIREALMSRVADTGGSLEITLAELQTYLDGIKQAANTGDTKTAVETLDDIDAGLALLAEHEITASSDAKLVTYAISFIIYKHQTSLVSGSNLSDGERAQATQLFEIGSDTKKWHDMLDVFDAAKSASAQYQIEQWQQNHGKSSRKGWNFDLLTDWIETFEDEAVRDRLYIVLDFFELN